MTLLSTEALSKSYGGLLANDGVSLELERGEIRALIGPNGAGKSTFVGMLCGRIPATSGSIFLEGQNITSLPVHKRIALGMTYTFQITSIFPQLSLHENIALAARVKLGGDAATVNSRVEAVLDRVGLLERSSQEAGDLSYGHQRILEMAMGMAQEPRLFILDEPTQGLALDEIEEFKSLIREMRQTATILLIEHNMKVVMELAERITVLESGRVLAEGAPDEIRSSESVQAAYLGTGKCSS